MLAYLQVLVHTKGEAVRYLHVQQVRRGAVNTHGVLDHHILHQVVHNRTLFHIRRHHQSARRVKDKVLHALYVGDEEEVGLGQLHVGDPVFLVRVAQQVVQAQEFGFGWQNVLVLPATATAPLRQVPDVDNRLERPWPFQSRALVGPVTVLQHGNEGPGVAAPVVEQNRRTEELRTLRQVKLLLTQAADLGVEVSEEELVEVEGPVELAVVHALNHPQGGSMAVKESEATVDL